MAGPAGDAPRMWCPRHDRTYARRSRCPRCKTPLIRIDPPRRRHAAPLDAPPPVVAPPPRIERDRVAEPAVAIVVPGESGEAPRATRARRVHRSLRVPATVAAAVLLSFALGTAVPRNRPPAVPAAARAPSPATAIEARPYLISSMAGVSLRLERVEQLGARVEITVRVLRGFDVAALREVFLDVVLRDGRHVEVDDASVRAGRTRFGATFLLPDGESRIRRLRITGLRTASDEEPLRMVSSIAGAWPVPVALQPRVVPSNAIATSGRTRVRWVSTILWSDRVEVVLDISAFTKDAKRSFGYAELFEHDGVSEPLAAGFVGARDEGTRLHLDFAGVRDDASRLVLFLGQPTTVLDGPWAWSIGRQAFRTATLPLTTESCGADLRKQRHPCP